jgi:hypothetical protein
MIIKTGSTSYQVGLMRLIDHHPACFFKIPYNQRLSPCDLVVCPLLPGNFQSSD